MKLEIKRFGDFLISRPAGKEAFLVFQAYMKPENNIEPIEVDFSGIKVLTPSWADEFLGALKQAYGTRVKLLRTDNVTVLETLKVLTDLKME